MYKIVLSFICLFASASFSVAQEYYDHNGSVMRLEKQGTEVSIYYEKPRDGLQGVGVRPGTLLFRGKLDNTNYLDGMSRIFSRRCGEVYYYVYGDFRIGQTLVLRGAAPVLGKGNCRIVDNTYEGSNANLVFEPVKNPGTQTAQKAPERKSSSASGPGSACVTNVRPGSTLNMRAGPSTAYGIVAEIPFGSCDVQIGDTCIADWCGIRHQTNVGWVNTKFLKRR